jgi:hypothetical protein
MATKATIAGNTFLLTGTLIEFTRDEAEALVEANGGKVISGVTAKLNYLVVGEDAGSKLDKAKKLGTVKILSEKEFLKMVPKGKAAASKPSTAKVSKATASKKSATKDSAKPVAVKKNLSNIPKKKDVLNQLGKTENQILNDDFNWSKIDLDAAAKYFSSANYNGLHLFVDGGPFRDDCGEYFYSDFFEIFNPDTIFFILQQPVYGFIELNFSADPTDYIIEDFGRLNRNLTLSFTKSETEMLIGLEREFFYDYDDVEDEAIIKRIIKIEKNDKSNKIWSDLSIKLSDKLNANKIATLLNKHFKSSDIWI